MKVCMNPEKKRFDQFKHASNILMFKIDKCYV